MTTFLNWTLMWSFSIPRFKTEGFGLYQLFHESWLLNLAYQLPFKMPFMSHTTDSIQNQIKFRPMQLGHQSVEFQQNCREHWQLSSMTIINWEYVNTLIESMLIHFVTYKPIIFQIMHMLRNKVSSFTVRTSALANIINTRLTKLSTPCIVVWLSWVLVSRSSIVFMATMHPSDKRLPLQFITTIWRAQTWKKMKFPWFSNK